MSTGARGVALHDALRRGVAVAGRKGAGQDVVAVDQGAQPAYPSSVQKLGRQAQRGLQRHALLELPDILLTAEHEQVADLLQVDLPARPSVKVSKRIHAPLGDLDVQCVGELRAHAAGGPRRRATAELVAFEQHDVHAGLGQMERGARSHHSATDDDHVGRGRERGALAGHRHILPLGGFGNGLLRRGWGGSGDELHLRRDPTAVRAHAAQPG